MPRRREPQTTLGHAIREAREQRGLTQRELARRSGTDVSWLSRLESGSSNPAWGTVRRLAAAMGMRASELALRAEELEEHQG